ncbi:MAG: TerB family tellurite resistance protein [Cyanobacteria bacterium P01_D01_bin.123]
MTATTPPPISPKQMNILRAVTAMAWADGMLEANEIAVMTAKLSEAFADTPAARQGLAEKIRSYFNQQIPLEEVLPKLPEASDRRFILKVGYLVISASARDDTEPLVNKEELGAFQKLARMLELSDAEIHEVSEAVKSEFSGAGADPLESLVQRFGDRS